MSRIAALLRPARWAPASLSGRLIAWQALALLLAWLALAALLTWRFVAWGTEEVDIRLRQMGTVLVSAAGSPEPELAQRLAAANGAVMALLGLDEEVGNDLHPVYQVWDAQGRLLARSPRAPDARLDAAAAPGQVSPWVVQQADAGQGRLLLVAEPREVPLSAVMPVLLLVFKSQLGIFLWHGLVIWFSVRLGLRPLAQLAQRIARRPAGELAPVQVDRLYTETAPLVSALNGLLLRESQRLEAERRFLADAAHELRTPLAAVNAQAHLLLAERAEALRAEAALALREGVARVSHLLAQLLTLARAEDGVRVQPPELLDASALLRERVAQLAPLARQRTIELVLEAPQRVTAQLERSGFCSIVDNLVDNAIRYTPNGGRVEVRLQAAAGLTLTVLDNGRGIPPEQRERVLERFYRAPGTTEQGTGLGLAIVKRLAERGGAGLSFIDGLDGRGIGLRLQWPQRVLGDEGAPHATAARLPAA
ncbi:two-component sensor histidine kinase [Roseateles sp. DAIF2]|uniref:ATP-binding protein n=1 Tax=Roseateles sp. DAIF2 TaxID=2714952 RepID=UPI0018A33519|nr:ATP-binding protein [Roseateles sp. DAIF2]QPF75624.1 two-component sensor histidine kinase [Roseateles sp. DAIF2]